jgi:hypothetical protein
VAQPRADDPEGRFKAKLRTIWPFRPSIPWLDIFEPYTSAVRHGSRTTNLAAADPLIALVRLLARQAAAEFAVHASAPAETSNLKPEDRE